MTRLKFSDGEEFDLSGSLRKEHRTDGWYVIGGNKLVPVKNEEEADEYIYKHSPPSSCKDSHQWFGIRSS